MFSLPLQPKDASARLEAGHGCGSAVRASFPPPGSTNPFPAVSPVALRGGSSLARLKFFPSQRPEVDAETDGNEQ